MANENKRKRTETTENLSDTFASRMIFFGLCATIILITLAYGGVHQPILALFYLGTILVVGLWAFDALASGALRFNKSLTQIPLIGAIIYGIFQIIPFGTLSEVGGVSGALRTISWDANATQNAVVFIFALLVFFSAMLTFVNSPKRLRTVAYLITFFGFAFSFFAVIQYFLSPRKIYGVYEVAVTIQPFGSFVNRHNFAAFIVMSLAIPLGLLFTNAIENQKTLFYWTAIALMGIAIVMSGSRGGFVALLAMLIFLIIFSGKKSSRRKPSKTILQIGLAGVLLAVIIGGAYFIGGDSGLSRIAESVSAKDPTSSRTHIWNTTWQIIKSAPVFGVGWGAYGAAYPKFDTLNGMERVEQAHNDYLQIIADAGIFGVIIGAFFLFALFREGFKQFNSHDKFRRGIAIGAFAGCFAVLVHSLFDFVLHITAVSLLFLTLVSLAVLGKQVENDEDEEIHDKQHRKRKPATVTPITANAKFQSKQ